jgi:uncharacterized protein YqeY
MTLKDRLRDDLNAARRGRDRLRTTLLTTTLSELRNREIELGREAEDADVTDVLARAIKRRREAAEQMRAGGRAELAGKEDAEALLLQAYLPQPLTEPEVRAIIAELVADGADSIGAVMGRLVPRIRGRYDARDANRLVKEALG